jgi:phosphatidylserine decarboxylase
MKDTILLQLMRLMPTHTMSRWVGQLAKQPFSKTIIPYFSKRYNITLDEAEHDIHHYQSLNEFFTRRLKTGLRPVASHEGAVVSPADGKVAAFGTINKGMLVQAKDAYYSIWDLLGISPQEASRYDGGTFITIYLSPRDYHRVHSPIEGQITDYSYIPGTLFPVNAFGVRVVKGLFAMNERLVTFIESGIGRVGVVKVGATIVGSVKVGYDKDATTNVKAGTVIHKKIHQSLPVTRGEELGFFEFGSTVVLVFEKGKIEFAENIKEGSSVKMGEQIASRVY